MRMERTEAANGLYEPCKFLQIHMLVTLRTCASRLVRDDTSSASIHDSRPRFMPCVRDGWTQDEMETQLRSRTRRTVSRFAPVRAPCFGPCVADRSSGRFGTIRGAVRSASRATLEAFRSLTTFLFLQFILVGTALPRVGVERPNGSYVARALSVLAA